MVAGLGTVRARTGKRGVGLLPPARLVGGDRLHHAVGGSVSSQYRARVGRLGFAGALSRQPAGRLAVRRHVVGYPRHPRIRAFLFVACSSGPGVASAVHSGSSSIYRDVRRRHSHAFTHYESSCLVRHRRRRPDSGIYRGRAGLDHRAVLFKSRTHDRPLWFAIGGAAVIAIFRVAHVRTAPRHL